MGEEATTVVILAGGRSKRMGQDKAWLDLNGQPLVEWVARRVLPLADEVIFSTGDPEQYGELRESLGVPVQLVVDDHPGAGPLAGLCAGLRSARNELTLVLATDMPFVSVPLLAYMRSLAAGYDAVVPLLSDPDTGRPMREPLHAFYRRTCLPAIERRMAYGQYQAFGFLPEVRTRDILSSEILQFDPAQMTFFNVNTPDNWARGRQIAKALGRPA